LRQVSSDCHSARLSQVNRTAPASALSYRSTIGVMATGREHRIELGELLVAQVGEGDKRAEARDRVELRLTFRDRP
jgi:hypothetical protein